MMKDQNIMRVLKWLPQMQPFSFLKTTNGQIFDVCVLLRELCYQPLEVGHPM